MWLILSYLHPKVNLGVLGMSHYVSKGVPQSCLDPIANSNPWCLDLNEVGIRLLSFSSWPILERQGQTFFYML